MGVAKIPGVRLHVTRIEDERAGDDGTSDGETIAEKGLEKGGTGLSSP